MKQKSSFSGQRTLAGAFTILIIISLLVHFPFFSLATAAPSKFFYFNPDSTQINFRNLKIEMNRFFEQNGFKVDFQAFAHYQDFHEQVKEQHPDFLFIPNWYLKQPDIPRTIKPLLIPLRKGKPTYIKVLMAGKLSDTSLDNLTGKTLAMTTLGYAEGELLEHILLDKLDIAPTALNIIHVPKDLDALIALAIGQVDLALVSYENIAELRRINPVLLTAVKSLAESDPLPLPALYLIDGRLPPEQVETFQSIFLKSGRTPHKYKIMDMLQIDDWKKAAK